MITTILANIQELKKCIIIGLHNNIVVLYYLYQKLETVNDLLAISKTVCVKYIIYSCIIIRIKYIHFVTDHFMLPISE